MADKLLSTAKARWLFAETLVIVLGVLIALALDDYRTERDERQLEIDYVQRIQTDVNRDINYLTTNWYPRLDGKSAALDAIAPVVRHQVPVPEDVETFLINVSRGGMQGASIAGWVNDITFRDLRSTGNFRLIRSPDVRAQIGNYYSIVDSQIKRVEARDTNYVSFVHSVLPAELREDMNIESMDQFGVDFALKRLLSDEFRIVMNKEYNRMLFMRLLDFAGFAESMNAELESYLEELKQE